MRYEFIISLIMILPTIGVLYFNKVDFKWSLTIFLITIYGPTYALIVIGSYGFNLSLTVCAIIILVWLSKIDRRFILFFFLLLLVMVINFYMWDFGFKSFFKGMLSLFIGLIGAIVGYNMVLTERTKYLKILAIIFSILAIITTVVRYFYAVDLRDAGLPLIIVAFAFSLALSSKYLASSFIFSYLFSTMTRAIQVSIFYSLLANFKSLRKRIGLFSTLFIFSLFIIIISYIFYVRTFDYIKIDDSINLTMITRIAAIESEIESFLQSPIIGQGAFFYNSTWVDLTQNQILGIDGIYDYIAYNHIGYTSTLAQMGIIGFILLIIIPFQIWRKFKPLSVEDKLISQTFILYLISFFISGSPIRTDFPDQFYYYFFIGYMIASNKKFIINKLKSKIKLKKLNL